MKGQEYVELCKRTDAPGMDHIPTRILHGALGCGTEAGELLDAVKRALFYGREIDRTNMIEELGDLSWYMSQLIDELDTTWDEVWSRNIEKLKKRYPHQFDRELAVNRDLDGERQVLEATDNT